MKRKWIFAIFGIVMIIAIISIVGKVNAKTIYVGPSERYTSIQDAVDNATDGDTIIVKDGIYCENIEVNKRLMIKSENGPDNCIIDGKKKDYVIAIGVDGVTIEGFTIKNASSFEGKGIKISSNYNNIRYNKISNNDEGIYFYLSSSKNNITYNDISNNNYGIFLLSSSNNFIAYNNISNNEDGIWLAASNNNRIVYNYISSNPDAAVYIGFSNSNRIVYNSISRNGDGICIDSSLNNFIMKNNLIDNRRQAYFFCSLRNHWWHNYWGWWRIPLPRPIFGVMGIVVSSDELPIGIPIPGIDFDWFPAIKPYNIGW